MALLTKQVRVLSAIIHVHNGQNTKSLYNTAWLIQHGCALSTEYTHRYGKEHGCRDTLWQAKKVFHRFSEKAITCYNYVEDYAFAGPDQFKYDTSIDTLTAYKRYISSKP